MDEGLALAVSTHANRRRTCVRPVGVARFNAVARAGDVPRSGIDGLDIVRSAVDCTPSCGTFVHRRHIPDQIVIITTIMRTVMQTQCTMSSVNT